MDNKVVDIILDRLDKIEDKIDILMGSRGMAIGAMIVMSTIGGFLSSILFAYIERH